MATATATKRFLLRGGMHIQDGPEYTQIKGYTVEKLREYAASKGIEVPEMNSRSLVLHTLRQALQKTYRPGDTFDGPASLGWDRNKYEEISSETPLGSTGSVPPLQREEDGLDAMSYEELKKYAKENGVNTGSTRNKEDLATLIRTTLQK